MWKEEKEDPFQFHKGTIRTAPDFLTVQREQDFNSIKVRLELENESEALILEAFQFHKGTIRTL